MFFTQTQVVLVLGASEADALYEAKKTFALAAGRGIVGEGFPLYADRFPDELVQYLRMACSTPQHLLGRTALVASQKAAASPRRVPTPAKKGLTLV